ncbi:MAG: GDSL-type esterase/lipase family protein [Micromonosporaceae bacterium]
MPALVAFFAGIPAANAASAVHYIALGDSYSSGLGAGSYDSSSGSCERSANAYPQQWANSNAPALFTSVACAGATTSDVLNSQVSALNSATTLVSITIGGNDAGFASIMETCVLQSDSACISAISSAGSFVANGQKLGYLPALSAATG